MDFTLAGAHDLLRTLQDAGYAFHDFGGEVPASGAVLLRHDIDLDLEDALPLARVEAELGIRATYFVLTTSPLYNIASRRGRRILHELVRLGHVVGVHIDPSAYADTSSDPRQALALHLRGEADLIESVTEVEVTSFSLHRPSDWDTAYPDDVGSLASAYSPRYFADIRYSSDSEGWWRFGAFVDSPDFRQRRSVQLLLHPEWWTGEPGEEPGPRLDRLVRTHAARACDDVIATINPYGPYLAGRGGWPDASVTRPEARAARELPT